MFCQYCGKELSNDSKFCPNCGQAVNNGGFSQPNNNYNSNNYNNSFQTEKSENSAIGILAIIFSVIGGWIGLIFAIIGLVTYKEEKNRKNCKIALGISIALIIIWLIFLIVGLVNLYLFHY